MMFAIISWVVYGLIVGFLAKSLHPGEDEPQGWLATIFVGVAGSFIGGIIGFVLNFGRESFSPAGILMGVLGGVVFCWLYSKYRAKIGL